MRAAADGFLMDACVPPCRPAAEYEAGRITKPPRRTVGVPFAAGQDGAAFVAQVAAQLPSRARIIVVS